MGVVRIAMLGFALIFAGLSSANAENGPMDNRELIIQAPDNNPSQNSYTAPNWFGIGTIVGFTNSKDSIEQCAGALIAPDLAIVSLKCVHERRSYHQHLEFRFKPEPGRTDKAYAQNIWVPSQFDPIVAYDEEILGTLLDGFASRLDIAVLELSSIKSDHTRNAGDSIGHFGIRPMHSADWDGYLIAPHRDKPEDSLWIENCEISETDSGNYYHDCQMVGRSGVILDELQELVIGVSDPDTGNKNGHRVAPVTGDIYDDISSLIEGKRSADDIALFKPVPREPPKDLVQRQHSKDTLNYLDAKKCLEADIRVDTRKSLQEKWNDEMDELNETMEIAEDALERLDDYSDKYRAGKANCINMGIPDCSGWDDSYYQDQQEYRHYDDIYERARKKFNRIVDKYNQSVKQNKTDRKYFAEHCADKFITKDAKEKLCAKAKFQVLDFCKG